MKKTGYIAVILAFLLCGCTAQETMETIGDDMAAPVAAEARLISLVLPAQAASPTVESGTNRLYQCDTYDIRVQTLDGGDLNKTIRTVSGYERDSLTVMEREKEGFPCYEFVWVSAGESGELVGRSMILDDGYYHYCVSVLGEAEWTMENQVYWQELFDSFALHQEGESGY